MRRKSLPPGTRVQLKVRAISSWPGTRGTILEDCGTIVAIKDGFAHPSLHSFEACRHELTVLRDQTPNPEHAHSRMWRRARGTDHQPRRLVDEEGAFAGWMDEEDEARMLNQDVEAALAMADEYLAGPTTGEI